MNHPANPSPPDPLSGGRNAFSGANPRPFVVWLTGVSGAGKSTLASLLKLQLDALGHRTYLLDGDTLREGLNRDLGFSDADRRENIRRTAEVARLMTDAGFIVIAALISPFADARAQARARFAPGTFVEVFVDVALEVAEARDPKGLYVLARRGAIQQFTGIGSPYEQPASPEVHVRTAEASPDACVAEIMRQLPL
ncbi:adenylyl-sulfate kinase [Burkholderia vietnamiensis]|uniref:adenylyl-sulfate kinase n=1 Tax=Burkholderia vietnamiensis TaxID=60552 RepID=UPI0007576A98|nr:adenylyl-sulfate kinase [Burkholderia vietnamiensis]KVE95406.1 adenylyl-sulfate kinase [Burkholderia vietnamiensis]KVF24994.1 adenylyl-sulfate kinase [Burkholderia vietnamiensis]MBR7914939.1 adenylyl-sulfate kinase [Burkholderia vietnamiensis]HDR9159390.1 adenylyl-sulfate kinase [Burkholderia vietnamiensis]HDR9354566.1 adenylyl-sulfate kinase [Burkholderia vietnamiensis]